MVKDGSATTKNAAYLESDFHRSAQRQTMQALAFAVQQAVGQAQPLKSLAEDLQLIRGIAVELGATRISEAAGSASESSESAAKIYSLATKFI